MHAGLEAAVTAWAGDPVLAAPLADPACAYLILDRSAAAVRYASRAAAALRAAVADADGALDPGLAAQIRAAGAPGRPRLLRLRLDPRRVAPPTACLLAAGELDGVPALILVATGPLPRFRPRPPAVPRPAAEDAASVPAGNRTPAPGARFVWRSDADDRIAALSGASCAALAAALVGQAWGDLAETGRLREADAVLDAVRSRQTFRALPAILALDAAGTFVLDLSGARVGRGGEAFAGFGGYGVVRAVTAPERSVAPATGLPETAPAEAAAREPVAEAESGPPLRVAEPALPDARSAPWPPVSVDPARFGAGADARDADPAPTPPATDATDPPASAAVDQPALSVTEHAAFREIARALGARYAGDEGGVSDAPDPVRGASGAVMPFPTPRAAEPDPTPAAAPFEDLPAAVLIHRGDAVLAANRRLLDLTGHADLASLQAAGVARLFRGLPPAPDAAEPDRPRVIATAGGASRPVSVEHGPTLWAGAPAQCLILRTVAEADPVRERAAESLAASFREGHAADARAALDALDDGVVTLDPGSRIVGMNRAAADLFACDPCEVVGTAFDALFEASQRDAVRAGLAGLGTETPTTAASGRRLTLRVRERDGARVAVLRPPAEGTARPASGARSALPDRLDVEVRPPVGAIVGLADGVLAAPHGPLDERDRAALRAIRAAGERVDGLISDLIALATIESGGLSLAVRPLPLNDLVSGCVERLQPEAARGRIVLRTSFAPDLAPLEADEASLRQAALSVIGRAIRETGAGGQVIVSTAPGERGGSALKVRGTGPGPVEGGAAREPFGTGEARGAGFGLPLSRALIEANRGHLRISSRGGEGTLVEILLPGPHSRSA